MIESGSNWVEFACPLSHILLEVSLSVNGVCPVIDLVTYMCDTAARMSSG